MERTYQIKCTKCPNSAIVFINRFDGVEWKKITGVISARKRLDGQWGWQCMCGNNSLMTKQEKQMIKNYQAPEPQELSAITKNLQIEPDTKFTMETV